MANIPGASNVLPGVITDVVTQTRAVSVPGGIRIAALVGEGSRTEVIVSSALGGGKDGFNSTYTSANGSDGRHFLLKFAPIISNRTTLFKNGVPLVGLEAQIDSNAFDNRYDYRIDTTSGKIELQTAHLKDLGGSFYSAGASNVGQGTLDLTSVGNGLVDINAPTETWTIKCVSVARDNTNAPIPLTARFLAVGSVSGQKLDANGNPVIWVANGQVVSNGILKFAINESTPPFREGDSFTVKVSSGVLGKNDTLTATYIGVADINDPVFFTTMEDIVVKHGNPSLDNTLSLGANLAFANSPPGVLAMQAAPALPRRSSFVLDEVNASALDDDEFIFPLPLGVTPNFDSNIHFFVTNLTTGVETQILPNKQEFYTLDSGPLDLVKHTFIFDDVIAPSGHSYFYTVIKDFEALNFGEDGYIGRDLGNDGYGVFSSSVSFDSSYIGKGLKIIDSQNSANLGLFRVMSVTDGKLNFGATGSVFSSLPSVNFTPTYLSDFITETSGLAFEVIDPVTGLVVDGYFGSDGYVVSTGAATGDGYFKSLGTIDFSTVPGITGLKLKIAGSTVGTQAFPIGNDGLYDITSVSGTGINIEKELVNESNLEYEILDADKTSDFVVVNHNVVPDGNLLRVTLIDDRDSGFFDGGWVTALETLETVECDILVTLPKQTISVIFHNALNHCLTMSTNRNKKERVLFLGAISGLTPDNVLGNKPAAVEDIGVLEGIQGDSVAEILAGDTEDLTNYSVVDGFGNTFRAVYFYPDQIVAVVGGENTFLDGFYIAAAAAGFLSGVSNVSIPLTNKVISGFNILKNKQFTQTVLENLAGAGITVLQPVAGGGRVLWGKTTTQSGFPEEEEISIVFIRDRIAKTLRDGFAGFIGIPEDPDVSAMFTARATGLLKSFISQRLITDYANLQVKRDDVDPRQWDISVQVQPVYPVNWIYIRVGVGLI